MQYDLAKAARITAELESRQTQYLAALDLTRQMELEQRLRIARITAALAAYWRRAARGDIPAGADPVALAAALTHRERAEAGIDQHDIADAQASAVLLAMHRAENQRTAAAKAPLVRLVRSLNAFTKGTSFDSAHLGVQK